MCAPRRDWCEWCKREVTPSGGRYEACDKKPLGVDPQACPHWDAGADPWFGVDFLPNYDVKWVQSLPLGVTQGYGQLKNYHRGPPLAFLI
ncbi:hypothetical protein HYALB_00010791 [Hymenoscyphus albidus]|uniref:Uncharacterized protein n=1 Tax=Hymenoscyphus albidus TaxID=595503 RepID=A0A9N9Q4N2_9HELO|nr:hypothetical protein HYALB_00010791 [Hymenoscyphus albidus]